MNNKLNEKDITNLLSLKARELPPQEYFDALPGEILRRLDEAPTTSSAQGHFMTSWWEQVSNHLQNVGLPGKMAAAGSLATVCLVTGLVVMQGNREQSVSPDMTASGPNGSASPQSQTSAFVSANPAPSMGQLHDNRSFDPGNLQRATLSERKPYDNSRSPFASFNTFDKNDPRYPFGISNTNRPFNPPTSPWPRVDDASGTQR